MVQNHGQLLNELVRGYNDSNTVLRQITRDILKMQGDMNIKIDKFLTRIDEVLDANEDIDKKFTDMEHALEIKLEQQAALIEEHERQMEAMKNDKAYLQQIVAEALANVHNKPPVDDDDSVWKEVRKAAVSAIVTLCLLIMGWGVIHFVETVTDKDPSTKLVVPPIPSSSLPNKQPRMTTDSGEYPVLYPDYHDTVTARASTTIKSLGTTHSATR
jgi:hypothetical protein